MIDDKMYSIELSFTQTVTGEAYGTSEEQVREKLNKEFEEAPDFRIIKVEYLGEASQMSLDLSQSLN